MSDLGIFFVFFVALIVLTKVLISWAATDLFLCFRRCKKGFLMMRLIIKVVGHSATLSELKIIC